MSKYDLLYNTAAKEMGQKEIYGGNDNPRIVAYHQPTTLKATDDETAWCASFICWLMAQNGISSTRSAAAVSFMNWGVALSTPVRGCVTVLKHPNGRHHVGLFDRIEGNYVYLLGGNQSNMVKVSAFPKSEVMGYRGFADVQVPVESTMPPANKDAAKALQIALNQLGANPMLTQDGIIGPKTKAAMQALIDS